LLTNQTQNFRRPLLAAIIVSEAHTTTHTDKANSRLKTRATSFTETAAVILIFVEMKVVKNWHN